MLSIIVAISSNNAIGLDNHLLYRLPNDLKRFKALTTGHTLTPGTITVSVEGDKLTVHCLDKSMLDTSPDGTFQKWIRKMEER